VFKNFIDVVFVHIKERKVIKTEVIIDCLGSRSIRRGISHRHMKRTQLVWSAPQELVRKGGSETRHIRYHPWKGLFIRNVLQPYRQLHSPRVG